MGALTHSDLKAAQVKRPTLDAEPMSSFGGDGG